MNSRMYISEKEMYYLGFLLYLIITSRLSSQAVRTHAQFSSESTAGNLRVKTFCIFSVALSAE